MNRYITILLLLINTSLFAITIKGVVKSESGEPVPYVSIIVKPASLFATADENGQYSFKLNPGKYIITFDLIGYEHEEREICVKAEEPSISLLVTLKEKQICLSEVVVCYKKNNEGRDIMRKVRAKRKFYNDKIQTLNYNTTQKISLEKEVRKHNIIPITESKDTLDSLNISDSTIADSLLFLADKDTLAINYTNLLIPSDFVYKSDTTSADTTIKKHLIYLTESNNKIYFEKPSKYKVIVNAQHEYFGIETYYLSRDRLFTYSIGSENAIPIQYIYSNPYIIYEDVSYCDFNFYDNTIKFPAICEKPILTPLAASAELNYRFILYNTIIEDNKKIYKIAVKPVFKNDAFFSGFIYIEDSTWAIKSVDLNVNNNVLLFCNEFKVKQDYTQIEPDIYFPLKTEIEYNIRDGKRFIYGNVMLQNSNFEVNKTTPEKIFNDEVKEYKPDYLNKDSVYWDTCRVFRLNKSDSLFIYESDTLKKYYQSEVYFRKCDSITNKFKLETIPFGYYHINRKTGFSYDIGGILNILKPAGIGGFRIGMPLFFMKTFKNEMQLDFAVSPDYGLKNKDLKGSASVRLLYYPKKFIGTALRFGDNYTIINNNASISQIFSRSNFVNARYYGITQQSEIANGLFAELSFDYSMFNSISNMHLEKWTTTLFGKTLNTPIAFDPYNKSEVTFKLAYRHKQKYIIKSKTKILLGSKYPEVSVKYRKGIKNLFGGQEDFDYVEFMLQDNRKLARFGTLNWQMLTGAFLNKSNLKVVENKYFRGSDPFIFSNPILSFQLLGPTLSTTNPFFQANFIHHFDGSITNKIPLFCKLKMDVCFGAGTFSIPKDKIYHFEMFVGLDKKIRIRTQIFKIGIYAITSDNTLGNAKFSFKIGVNTYESRTKKWLY